MQNEIRFYINLYPYENEARVSELKQLDNYAYRDIGRLEDTIKTLKDYRNNLFEHTQRLQSLESHLQLSLQRERRYTDKVYYHINIKRLYPTNEKMYQSILSETFPGTERSKAIKRFAELKKQYPGIESIKDIEKSRWEK